MLILHPYALPPPLQRLHLMPSTFSRQIIFPLNSRNHPFLLVSVQRKKSLLTPKAKQSRTQQSRDQIIDVEVEDVEDNEEEEVEVEDEGVGEGEGFYSGRPFRGKGEEKDYDKDPEFAEILGSCFDDPKKAQSRVEDRIRKKRNKILQPKTGSATPMKVTFNKFDFSNSYIWFEFYKAPLPSEISLICDTIRSWHIVGRLGGCNSMNMQLSQAPLEKRPNYDPVQGANVTPTTFYNIGDFQAQENLGRVWMDIGTSEPLLLDILINALTQISSDYVGIKQLVFGECKFENWKENLTSEAAGCSIHKI